MDKLFRIIILIIILAAVAFGVTMCVRYGNKPITELPAWAVRFFIK